MDLKFSGLGDVRRWGRRECDSREILESKEISTVVVQTLSVYGTEVKTNRERNNEGMILTLDASKLKLQRNGRLVDCGQHPGKDVRC
jgi:hypothetical protein